MFSLHPKPERRTSFEDVFFEHYERLMKWALQLTRQDRFEAEDLVQELYVRFARLGAVPDRIEDAEGYLFAVLRNLHYTRAKRTRTGGIDGLSIVDYDSIQHGLRAVDRSELLSVRSDLYGICNYLCSRKETSRSASIFILRFFLGYFPNEIAKVVQSTRVAVDKSIQTIRREARLNIDRPGTLRSIVERREPKPRISYGSENEPPLFMALRNKIFASCTGECLGYSTLQAKYGQDGVSFTANELAHLVSCSVCLDQANRSLGLPLLEDRSPDDTIGRDTPQGPNGASGTTPILVPSRPSSKKNDMERRRSRLKRCIEEADQHRPQRLLIVVDGEIRASQKVTAPLNELRVELGRLEEPSFIEVLSEQGYCLAFFPVDRPEPDGDLSQTQDTPLSDGRSLKLVVSFLDETPSIQVVYLDPLLAADTDMVETQGDVLQPTAQPLAFEEEETLAWPARLWSRLTGALSLNMNPFLVSATLFGLCSIACLVMWTRSGPRISPRTFLSRAQQSDASAVASVRDGVIYQKVRISMPGHAMERAIYRDPQQKRKPRHRNLNPSDQQLRDRLDVAGVKWNDPLSAVNYAEWRDGLAVKQDAVTRIGNDLLTLTTSTQSDSPVLKESLTVRVSDFHPVERTIELRDEGTVQIAELNYDVMPWGAVNQEWFEPLTGDVSSSADIHPALHLPRMLSDLELDQAELGARLTLNRLHGDQGEQIHLARSANGIEVKGVVDTEQRKKQLISQLLLVPHVRPSLLSVEELGNNPLPSTSRSSEPIHAYSVESQPSPLEQYLRAKNLPTDSLAAISQSLLDGALAIQRAQGHLSELQSRFKDGGTLSGDLQTQFAKLSENYADAMRDGLATDNKVLVSLGLDTGTRPFPAASSSAADEDLAQQVRRYQALCQELIASGTSQPRSAQAIANDLVTVGGQIRMHIPHVPPASSSTARN